MAITSTDHALTEGMVLMWYMDVSVIGAAPYHVFMTWQAQQQQQEITEEDGGNMSVSIPNRRLLSRPAAATVFDGRAMEEPSRMLLPINGTVQRCATCLTVDCINDACILN